DVYLRVQRRVEVLGSRDPGAGCDAALDRVQAVELGRLDDLLVRGVGLLARLRSLRFDEAWEVGPRDPDQLVDLGDDAFDLPGVRYVTGGDVLRLKVLQLLEVALDLEHHRRSLRVL